MKNNLQKTNGRKARNRHILHVLRLAGFTSGLIILLALFHLLTIGIPAPLTRHITDQLQQKGILLHIDSITLSPRRGWVLHNLRLYSHSPDNLQPIIKTKKLYLNILPDRWTRLSETDWLISISGTNIRLSPEYQGRAILPNEHPLRIISQLQAHLSLSRKNLRIENAELLWGNTVFRTSGTMALPPPIQPLSNNTAESDQQPKPAIWTHAAEIIKTATAISFDSTPEINLQFEIPPEGFPRTSAQVSFFAFGLHWNDRAYEQIGGVLSLRNRKLSLDSLKIEGNDGASLSAFGRWDIPRRNALINLSNSLPAEDLIDLLPPAVADKLSQTGIRPFGKLEFDIIAGPAQPEKLLEQVNLHVHSMQITRDDLSLDQLRFDLTRNGQQLEVNNLAAIANGGPVSGNLDMDLGSGAWSASAEGRVSPTPIGKLLGGEAQEWIDRFDFTNHVPDISIELSQDKKGDHLYFTTAVSAQNFLCSGIPFDTMNTTMVYSNHTFSLSPLKATQDHRSIKGSVKLDFQKKLAYFNATSEFEPAVIAHIIAPSYPTVLTNFTFNGVVSCAGSGRIDFSGGTNHAAQGTIQAESVSAAGFTAKSFRSRVEARNSQLIFSSSSADLFGGQAEGTAVFDLQFNDHQAPYRLDIDATRLDLNQIARHVSTNDFSSTKGLVSATVNISADAAGGFWESATGYGEAEIEKGQLKDLPVLGGFSRLIRTTVPGFSLFSITTLYSKYKLQDGTFYTDNLELGGTLLSATAHGTYSPTEGLDFIVQAEPLRQIRTDKKWYMLHLWFADALKQGTAPLFRLLEFELKGPLNAPKWRLINLPKEVSQILQMPVKKSDTETDEPPVQTESP
ncbi:AsmA-like C-terminal region-containing protein [Tichowtungia aerotolerans]|uniref:Uncharacterized protein n=1 Tax=Tichowtungia aerotolerans TaxID=2697043 RepID=A0A6P1M6I8_9BACT|nr:AsmA-like C-terminal region-containing protein [Tichowtungia aerotolerans]QHI68214.1 hypothetical protein GT409_01690 [Tichowtungia aerotolerans]